MKKFLNIFICLLVFSCIQSSVSSQRLSTSVYDLNGERTNAVEVFVTDLIFKHDNGNRLVQESNGILTQISEEILSETKENENFVILDFKVDDENNPYPEIESMTVDVECAMVGGGVTALGKDYRLIYFGDEAAEDVTDIITDSDILGVSFTTDRLGKYVLYLDPRVLTVEFYMDEPVWTEGESTPIEKYYEINDLSRHDIVAFPTLPEKDGYVFTGWKARVGAGISFVNLKPITVGHGLEYYASWCPEDEYEPIVIEISSDEAITKGEENGKKISLKTNYGVFKEEMSVSEWSLLGCDGVAIESITKIDNKTVEITLYGNSSDIYSTSQISVEFNSELLDYEDTEKIRMDEDGVRAKMYRSDNTITLAGQIRPRSGGAVPVSKYKVSFDTNGGSEVANQSVTRNMTAREPDAPEKEGYTFAGWFLDKDFAEEYDFSSKVTKNITLYAKWNEIDLTKNQIILTIGKKEAMVFGEDKTNDVAPQIKEDRAYLPARFVAENLGAEVLWNGDAETVTISKDDIEIVITIGAKTAIVNGDEIELDYPAFVENDRTFTPVRFVAERLRADVDWTPDNEVITITK